MIRFAADENFNGAILKGLQRRVPDVDVVRIQDTEICEQSDEVVLEWAYQHNRVLLTHDVNTITKYAYERLRSGLSIAGLFEIGTHVSIGIAVEQLTIIAQCSLHDEWHNQIRFIPLS